MKLDVLHILKSERQSMEQFALKQWKQLIEYQHLQSYDLYLNVLHFNISVN